MTTKLIDTDKFSEHLRGKGIDVEAQRVLIAKLSGSGQERDLTEPVNCGGYGRVRHFRERTAKDWSTNPLPIVPAAKALGRLAGASLRAQVFQNAVCNWRCWYCYVDFNRLSGNRRFGSMLTAEELVELFLAENASIDVVDLSGGQPDLTPEWVLWMMRAFKKRGLQSKYYLWSDDNLSNFYFWEFLTESDIAEITEYPMYGRVCCFKGFDEHSFGLNTLARPELFDRQFEIFGKLLRTGMDLYAYVTLTSDDASDVAEKVERFVDRLQAIHERLPLRTIPLRIDTFTPTKGRIGDAHRIALKVQHLAHEAWVRNLETRFSSELRQARVTDIRMA